MPLRRYFLFIGGVLLTLLFLIDWYVPQAAIEAARADVDRSTIRIHTAHRWPTAVVFDTAQPTIAAPPQPTLAAIDKSAAGEKSPRDALALASASEIPTVAAATPPVRPKHAKARVRAARAPSARVATYEPFGFRPFFQTGW